MGAEATVADLETMSQLFNVDFKEKADTLFGRCSLAVVFAQAGRAEELRYVLDRGAEVGDKVLRTRMKN